MTQATQPGIDIRMSDLARSVMQNDDLRHAFTLAIPGAWPEGAEYCDAEQPAAIGKVLQRTVHRHLRNLKIGYLFKEKIKSRGRQKGGKASKADPKVKHLAGFDFMVEVSWQAWKQANEEQRVALIDHELCHFGTEEDDKGNVKLVLLDHDIEEFTSIVQRWGIWHLGISGFHEAVQLSLGLTTTNQET